MKYRFSPTQLNLFKDSPLCFWLDKKMKCARPRGIFPSLPGGMDRILKNYFDDYRHKDALPQEIGPELGVELYKDQDKLDLWRNWRTGLEIDVPEANTRLGGAFDDLAVTVGGGLYVPLDYKTKGSPTTEEDARKYYQLQLDCYALMLQESGMQIAGFGILSYWSPANVIDEPVDHSGAVRFETQTIVLDVDPKRAREMVIRAAECLESPRPPMPDFDNEYFKYYSKRRQAMDMFENANRGD